MHPTGGCRMPLDTESMAWQITDDGVMGGLSQSRATAKEGAVVFEGKLSLENNGGFASVRAALETPLRCFHGIRLTVAGDGRRYQFRLREDTASRGIAWRAEFEAGPESRRITLLPEDFEPVVRGEVVIGAPPLSETTIRHLGLMLSRDSAGPFRLEVRDMEFMLPSEGSGTRLVIGAGRGIGRALLDKQLQNPEVKRVIGTFRPGSEPADMESLRQAWGDRLALEPLDIGDTDSLAAFEHVLYSNANGIDLAINATGLLHGDGIAPEKRIEDCAPQALDRMFRVNAIGPLMVARSLLGAQPRKQPFTFIAISAMVGSISDNRLGGWYGYRASKTALNQFMHTLAIECRQRFPRAVIAAIHPGTTRTSLSRPFIRRIEPEKLYTTVVTAERILRLAAGFSPADSGRFFNWDGTEIPW